jgi:hypothetical protein
MKCRIVTGDRNRFVGEIGDTAVHIAETHHAIKSLSDPHHRVAALCGQPILPGWVGRQVDFNTPMCPRCQPLILVGSQVHDL